jgi:DNA replication protein DnaC
MESAVPPSSTSPPCPACGGTGFALVEMRGQNVARLCVCRRNLAGPAAVGEALEAARIPLHYRECEFDNFQSPGQDALALTEAKSLARRWATEYSRASERGLMFMGPPGAGKTHLAVAILRHLRVHKGVQALFYDVQDLLRTLQATFDRQSGMSELTLLMPVLGAEVLLLDDLGGRQFTPWVEETLTHIITTRYNERRPTLITTNYLDEPGDAHTPTLTDRIGPRVRSRLHEMCHLVAVRAQDFRRAVKRADHHRVADRIAAPGEAP